MASVRCNIRPSHPNLLQKDVTVITKNSNRPSKKTQLDRYRRLAKKRKGKVASNLAAPEISEVSNEAEELLGDMILQTKEI